MHAVQYTTLHYTDTYWICLVINIKRQLRTSLLLTSTTTVSRSVSLCCSVLCYCVVLRCTVLYCTVLCCTLQPCTAALSVSPLGVFWSQRQEHIKLWCETQKWISELVPVCHVVPFSRSEIRDLWLTHIQMRHVCNVTLCWHYMTIYDSQHTESWRLKHILHLELNIHTTTSYRTSLFS